MTDLAHACTAALAALADPALADPAPDPPPLHIVLADLDAILALVYALSTKLSLALKPPAPSYPASVPLRHDLAQHASALAHAARLLHPSLHGATLAKNVRDHVSDILRALRALAQTFVNSAGRDPQLPGSSPSGDEYLVRTGTLHDLIANARGPTGIPKDNRAAVCLSWKSDRDSLDDALQEVSRMIKQAESDDPATDLDDGWDELGLDHPTTLDKHELARAKNVHHLLRLTTLFHKRILLDLLAHPSSVPVSTFDSLLAESNNLLSASDDLIAALYAPQEPAHVRKQILELANIATALQTQISVLLPTIDELAKQLHALNVDNATPAATLTSESPPKKRADKKWFDTCVDQILRLCTTVSESSQADEPGDGNMTQHSSLAPTK